jgi:hypothetical protein
VVGASSFPRHWIYDQQRRLAAKTGLIDFRNWYANASPEQPRVRVGHAQGTL